jgi:hypothetical protein
MCVRSLEGVAHAHREVVDVGDLAEQLLGVVPRPAPFSREKATTRASSYVA